MKIVKKIIKNADSRWIYAFHGIIFGLLFPIISTLFQSFLIYSNISISSLIATQIEFPLLWVIDSAPLFLGLFAKAAGKRQQLLAKEMEIVEKANRQISIDITERKIIEAKLLEKEKLIEDDLFSARKIQRSFLPKIPDNRYFDFDFLYSPKNKIGGDFLKIVEQSDERVAIFIGDVSGHGIAAALLTATTLSLLNKYCCESIKTPEHIMQEINQEILEIIPDDRFITAIFGFLEKKGDEAIFTYVRAGHTFPIVWNSDSKKINILESNGMALGVDNGSDKFEIIKYKLKSGDRIFLYTDGVTDFIKSDGNDLNITGLKVVLENVNSKKTSFDKILKSIDQEIVKLGNEDSKQDDELMVLIELKPNFGSK